MDVEQSRGPLTAFLIGLVLSTFLTGLAACLTILYFVKYRLQDEWQHPTALFVCMSMNVLQIVGNASITDHFLVLTGPISSLQGSSLWATALTNVSKTICIGSAQLLLTVRVTQLSKSVLLGVALAVLPVTASIFDFAVYGIVQNQLPYAPGNPAPLTYASYLQVRLGLFLAGDVLIVAVITYLLLRQRSCYFPSTNKVIERIVKILIINASLTVPLYVASEIVLGSTDGASATAATAIIAIIAPTYTCCIAANLLLRESTARLGQQARLMDSNLSATTSEDMEALRAPVFTPQLRSGNDKIERTGSEHSEVTANAV